MGSFIDTAGAILSLSHRRVEVSAQNVANMTTYGYKKRVSFTQFLPTGPESEVLSPQISTLPDFSPGKLVGTDNPTDLAISGEGFFAVRSTDRLLYTRQGQFQRGVDGRLLTSQGLALQVQGGGDLILHDGPFEVTADGVVTQQGEAVAKLAIVTFTDPKAATDAQAGMFSVVDGAVTPLQSPALRQGMLEASNVSTGDEMVAIMEALRRAEAGQRLVNVYDDLMGRALTAFGQA